MDSGVCYGDRGNEGLPFTMNVEESLLAKHIQIYNSEECSSDYVIVSKYTDALKLKGNIQSGSWGNVKLVCKEKRDKLYLLSNVHNNSCSCSFGW